MPSSFCLGNECSLSLCSSPRDTSAAAARRRQTKRKHLSLDLLCFFQRTCHAARRVVLSALIEGDDDDDCSSGDRRAVLAPDLDSVQASDTGNSRCSFITNASVGDVGRNSCCQLCLLSSPSRGDGDGEGSHFGAEQRKRCRDAGCTRTHACGCSGILIRHSRVRLRLMTRVTTFALRSSCIISADAAAPQSADAMIPSSLTSAVQHDRSCHCRCLRCSRRRISDRKALTAFLSCKFMD